MSKRNHRTSLARIKSNDWHIGELGMENEKSKPIHSTIEINGVKIGKRRSGVVSYMLCNKKGESLKLEILHLLHNKEFVLKKERRIEALDDGFELIRKWREKGVVDSEGDIADVKTDMLLLGDKIII